MDTLNSETKGKVLIPTNEKSFPFLIKIKEDLYIAVRPDGTLTGDGFYKSDFIKYCPNAEL